MKRGPYKVKPIAERLLARRVISAAGCWEWTGSRLRGYGLIGIRSKTHIVHRVAYEEWVGPIPAGLEIDHLCRNTCCFNPDHLEPVTGAQNMARYSASITHCKNGHELTQENTYIRKRGRGKKECMTCRRIAALKSYHRRAAQSGEVAP